MTTATMALSVDDRRALWALTERHLRSEAFPAVLLVRDALRRGATAIDVRTRGDRLVVQDDGAPLDGALADIADVVRRPTVTDLHRLEATHGTDLLVALVTATSAEACGLHTALALEKGRAGDVATTPPVTRNRVVLARPRRRRAAEAQELRAWLPSPRASVRVDGTRIGSDPALPAGVFFPRQVKTSTGRGQIGIVLDDTVTRFTVLARGAWVSQELLRPRGLPLVGFWDSDVMPTSSRALLDATRSLLERAGDDLLGRVAADCERLGPVWRRRLRRALARGPHFPPAFLEVPLFDSARGPFTVSLAMLKARPRVVVGDGVGDVFVDEDARAFLRRELGNTMVEALPPPRRRLRFVLGLG